MMNFPRPETFGNFLLKDFGDIVLPDDLSWWPTQPGIWLLLAVIVTLCGLYFYKRYRHWQRNAYRREALVELAELSDLSALNGLIKKAAKKAFPAENIEPLWGEAWLRFLNSKTEQACFGATDELLLDKLLTKPQQDWPDDTESLREHVAMWLQQHKEAVL